MVIVCQNKGKQIPTQSKMSSKQRIEYKTYYLGHMQTYIRS